MEIRKETTISPMTTDGKIIEVGQTVIFEADGKCMAGIYNGITPRGAMNFSAPFGDVFIHFNVMPKSINKIYKAIINVSEPDFPMNPPVEY